ncbi:hypothetical protein Pla52n_15390 [Stieleria varia]|uniref:Uncharacterized protein n=1 Tax=Stieleria varia TaxID=2528005 RepID=A0A5C6B5Q1_9BACT|nr:hypothetical protein Pla52n_15390 [Stieleria varia]
MNVVRFTTTCPSCDRRMLTHIGFLGTIVRCSHCAASFQARDVPVTNVSRLSTNRWRESDQRDQGEYSRMKPLCRDAVRQTGVGVAAGRLIAENGP